ncbi:hypothetical protein chiPu_0025376 [Chiloscyllium punctatum]|uniref:Uncharacterized protein n=1 Tax=Chiloscyllium punctatum TaxID=137246 RepID=A0A401TEH3_CHIPU|nr:hypothetical protein [Chiloscyllium punctatum]
MRGRRGALDPLCRRQGKGLMSRKASDDLAPIPVCLSLSLSLTHTMADALTWAAAETQRRPPAHSPHSPNPSHPPPSDRSGPNFRGPPATAPPAVPEDSLRQAVSHNWTPSACPLAGMTLRFREIRPLLEGPHGLTPSLHTYEYVIESHSLLQGKQLHT